MQQSRRGRRIPPRATLVLLTRGNAAEADGGILGPSPPSIIGLLTSALVTASERSGCE